MTVGEGQGADAPLVLLWALQGELPEEGSLDSDPPDPVPMMVRGMMPGLLGVGAGDVSRRWWDSYVAGFLERDLRQISRVENVVELGRVMELAALRTGEAVNQSEIARLAKVSQATVHRYLNLLETSHLFERVPAFNGSSSTQVVKAPKGMWVDPGLAVILSGLLSREGGDSTRGLEPCFAAFVYFHLKVLAGLMTPPARIRFWRTRRGDEVDFVVEHGRRVVAVAVTMTSRPDHTDTSGLRAFLREHPEARAGLLVHCGRETRQLAERVAAVPWTMLAGV
jgi:predicted AAA+ superfamily ATPase